ncbi:hypothetical protein D3C86_2188980 [compost metagenome]
MRVKRPKEKPEGAPPSIAPMIIRIQMVPVEAMQMFSVKRGFSMASSSWPMGVAGNLPSPCPT